jgi:hypothetical protein
LHLGAPANILNCLDLGLERSSSIRAAHCRLDSMTLNLRTPISIELVHGHEHVGCLARLGWDGTRLFATPFKPDRTRQPWRWQRIELDPTFVAGPNWSVVGRRYRYQLPVPMG